MTILSAIKNARIVTAQEHFIGNLSVAADTIANVAIGNSQVGEDWEGDYLIPGMVELHTDNLEKHLMPRPKVNWPILPAILAHDAQIAAAGITTVLDALGVGDIDPESVRSTMLAMCVLNIQRAREKGLLRVEHFLHLRLELAEENLLTMFLPFLNDPSLKLVSLMDHTPGQRQWTDLSHYRIYTTGKRGWSNEKVDSMLENMLERQVRYADDNRRRIVESCNAIGKPMATHDDTTVAHVTEGVAEGIKICEFPTSLIAAQTARQNGLGTIMGAPNVVRGGSHSGNISAAELARADLLDVLSSDYVPASLLHAAFLLQKEGFSLPKSINTVSRNPARMIGFDDRGEIAPGLRADFLRVRVVDDIPVILQVWKSGQRAI
ncbi:alpha-D-ribose 1-methylphosphonate 5-triphosphate diphosphatase [Glaciimonas sp. CA11.2]|uniref:alpha-D-ribose 1-methylphosphonate 5-triphosphate diphosphatase n=1 Tax=Glaciimonas sp. CA11.2 TaxID=3048601 RepID=UPI002AB409DF|nr:alpha-D-ribose 1-methylphosphonate 5-triphosphate diphosphatase [Glaciimonas sp. CA11.2]MDY7546327.1 alpha-D-ribose 1-methylphosphonate 5-triphosphate diphosphatase [Glaciimonas sp. CA11.2]MEB0161776.1 alpha-D-ribose 1-methylphosphonate 5-triphosphate diphosphatase [Glaciimonas sp. CA11.2]